MFTERRKKKKKSNFTNANEFQRVYSADGDNKCGTGLTIAAEEGLNTGHNLRVRCFTRGNEHKCVCDGNNQLTEETAVLTTIAHNSTQKYY